MARSTLVKANEKIAETVAEGYQKIENGLVKGFSWMTDRIVDQFLTRDGETGGGGQKPDLRGDGSGRKAFFGVTLKRAGRNADQYGSASLFVQECCNVFQRSGVDGDAGLLSLVWNNLFSNAIKFTGEGGTVSLRMFVEGKNAVVQGTDTGCDFGSLTDSPLTYAGCVASAYALVIVAVNVFGGTAAYPVFMRITKR